MRPGRVPPAPAAPSPPRTFDRERGLARGQPAIIDTGPGGGGGRGRGSVARAAPDGQTLIFAASSHNVTALLGANPPYDPIRDFAAVANIGMQSYVLMASAAGPARTPAEFVEDARSNPRRLHHASAGPRRPGPLSTACFSSLPELDIVDNPFK